MLGGLVAPDNGHRVVWTPESFRGASRGEIGRPDVYPAIDRGLESSKSLSSQTS